MRNKRTGNLPGPPGTVRDSSHLMRRRIGRLMKVESEPEALSNERMSEWMMKEINCLGIASKTRGRPSQFAIYLIGTGSENLLAATNITRHAAAVADAATKEIIELHPFGIFLS